MATESGPAANQNPQLDLNVQSDALTPTSQSGAGSGVSRDPVESNQTKSEDSLSKLTSILLEYSQIV